LYEAAVLAMRTFKQHDCEPALMSKLEVEIRSQKENYALLRKRKFGSHEDKLFEELQTILNFPFLEMAV